MLDWKKSGKLPKLEDYSSIPKVVDKIVTHGEKTLVGTKRKI